MAKRQVAPTFGFKMAIDPAPLYRSLSNDYVSQYLTKDEILLLQDDMEIYMKKKAQDKEKIEKEDINKEIEIDWKNEVVKYRKMDAALNYENLESDEKLNIKKNYEESRIMDEKIDKKEDAEKKHGFAPKWNDFFEQPKSKMPRVVPSPSHLYPVFLPVDRFMEAETDAKNAYNYLKFLKK